MQLVSPEEYARLELHDQWLEDVMQTYEAEWIVSQLKDCKTVLELGYGAGFVTRAMVKAGLHVTTIDGSADFCNKAIEDGADVCLTMFEDYDPAERFDCVIASFVLEHVIDPVALLKKCHQWSDRLIVVIGNANSYHRQLAVKMGLQPSLDSLSERDHKVGHYRVYSYEALQAQLMLSGWDVVPDSQKGFQFKPLPNSMMGKFNIELLKAMNEIDIPWQVAANIGLVAR